MLKYYSYYYATKHEHTEVRNYSLFVHFFLILNNLLADRVAKLALTIAPNAI